jgi:mitochondrial import inner membrane translocase subunit TIM54
MSDANPPAAQPASSTSANAAATAAPAPPKKPAVPPPQQNPALRMMGLPNLPRKLPSRNWMIFWLVTGSITSAIIYDKREKKRATAKWRRAVAPLAEEAVANARQMPRRLTIYLEAPPGDGMRVAQDHFIEYAKPVLGASGLDWEFVQGRQQGDVRAAVAEKVRRVRRAHERPGEEALQTDEAFLEKLRARMGLDEYRGVKGDIVVGRHAWKEYVRGLHEGWLGPLDAPTPPNPTPAEEAQQAVPPSPSTDDSAKADEQQKPAEEEKPKKPERPPQPPPHNSPADYAEAALPAHIPDEFAPAVTIPFPHRLGFSNFPTRLKWFFNRRKLADEVGREVAAACFAASREWQQQLGDSHEREQDVALAHEERDWPSSVWKDDPEADAAALAATGFPKEKIWTSPMVLDQRLAERMRRFRLTPEHEAAAAAVVVPEEEIEGWIKGSLRSLWQWGVSSFDNKPKGPNVGNLDE